MNTLRLKRFLLDKIYPEFESQELEVLIRGYQIIRNKQVLRTLLVLECLYIAVFLALFWHTFGLLEMILLFFQIAWRIPISTLLQNPQNRIWLDILLLADGFLTYIVSQHERNSSQQEAQQWLYVIFSYNSLALFKMLAVCGSPTFTVFYTILATTWFVIQLSTLATPDPTKTFLAVLLSLLFLLTLSNQAIQLQKNQRKQLQEVHKNGEQKLGALQQTIDSLHKKLRGRDLLLGTVSHDLKTPIFTITQNAQFSLSELEHPAQHHEKYLQVILRNAQRLSYQVEDILDFTRLQDQLQKQKCEDQEHELRVKIYPFSLERLLQDLHDIFYFQCEEKGLHFVVQKPERELQIVSDFVRVMQVLINLVGNSLKFTEQGQIKIEVTLLKNQQFLNPKSSINTQNLVRFRVQDTGVGMDEQQLARIFGYFSTFDVDSGTGLGLMIARKIVRQLGPSTQEIKVESSLNFGTVFQFDIFQNYDLLLEEDGQLTISKEHLHRIGIHPIKKITISDQKRSHQSFDSSLPSFCLPNFQSQECKIFRIGLVDDDVFCHQSFQKLIKRINELYFQNMSLALEKFHSGEQILHKIRLHESSQFSISHAARYDLIISDYNLANGADGLSLLEEIHDLYAQKSRSPVPALVLYSAEFQKLDETQSKYIKFFEKPLKIDLVRDFIQQILSIQ